MQFLLSLFIKLSQKRYFSLKKETGGTKEMWILYAIGSSFFAGITAVLAKCGIQKTNSNVATAIRTIVVLLFSWLMVFLTGAQTGLTQISSKNATVSCAFRSCNRFVVALLLQSFARWTGKCCRTDRQVEHIDHDRVFPDRLEREAY